MYIVGSTPPPLKNIQVIPLSTDTISTNITMNVFIFVYLCNPNSNIQGGYDVSFSSIFTQCSTLTLTSGERLFYSEDYGTKPWNIIDFDNITTIKIDKLIVVFHLLYIGLFKKVKNVTIDANIIDNGVFTLGNPFPACTNLTITDNVTVINNNITDAFVQDITNVTIYPNITNIYGRFISATTITIDLNTINNLITVRTPIFDCFPSCNTLIITDIFSNGRINQNYFNAATSITSVSLPSTIAAFGCAFNNCTILSMYIDSFSGLLQNSQTWFKNTFPKCNTLILDSISSSTITSNAFGNSDITSITSINIISTNAIYIYPNAFLNYVNLTNITINNLASIYNLAFSGCTSLTQITINSVNNNTLTVDWNAFNGCTNLTSITIPSNVTNIITQNGSTTSNKLNNFTRL
jgi:hypothetical protein